MSAHGVRQFIRGAAAAGAGLAGADGHPGIAPCMPGAQLTEVVDDKTYKGNIAVRLGPVALTFAGTGEVRGDRQRQPHRAGARAGHRRQGPRLGAGGRDVPARAVGRRLQGAGAHRSHAVGRGRAIRPRRRHDPGDGLGADESVRQQSEEAACAQRSAAAAQLGKPPRPPRRRRGQADLRLLADGQVLWNSIKRHVRREVAA